MSNESEIKLTWDRVGNVGVGVLRIVYPGGLYVDKIDITKKKDRAQVLADLHEALPGLTLDDIQARLEELAGKAVPRDAETEDSDSQADLLVALTEGVDVELFRAPGEQDTGGYATANLGGRLETWSIVSTGFKGWLRREFYKINGKAVRAQALVDALGLIEAKALYEGDEHPVSLRVAAHEGDVFIDLGTEDRRAIHITAAGWDVVESVSVPVRFIRRSGMLPLPVPTKRGSVDDLRPLVNLPTDELWVLFVGTLVAYLLPFGPYAVLVIYGEHGSAKSTLAKMVRKLIDPNKAALRRTCKSDEDLMIAASNGWIVAFDNLSDIRPGLSDSLCSLATGGAFATRKFYTNDEEKLFEAMRPVMVNGIDDLATRADFLDRAVLLELPSIDEADRRDEAEVWAAFERAAPGILGALLDGASSALRNRATVHLEAKPRMADFALCVTAAEEGLGWEPGTFMAAYMGNRADANRHAIEGVAVGPALERLMEVNQAWSGTATDLLAVLEGLVDEKARGRSWPKNGRGMSGALKRIAPNLRAIGIDVELAAREPGNNRRRVLHLVRRGGGGTVETPGRDGWDEPGHPNRPEENGLQGPSEGFRDGRDGRDGCIPTSIHGGENKVTAGSGSGTAEGDAPPRGDKVGIQPSRPSEPSRNTPGDPGKGDRPGRLRDGSTGSGTVDPPPKDVADQEKERDLGWAS